MKLNKVFRKAKHKLTQHRQRVIMGANLVAFIGLGVFLIMLTRAATATSSIEAEAGIRNGNVSRVDSSTASGSLAVRFGYTPPTGGPANYQASLAQLLASPYRNSQHDNSVFLNTPSAGLENQASLYGPRADYVNTAIAPYSGDVNTNSDSEGIFRTACEFSHFSYDDPIVYPNQPGKAHLHMFFGNTHVNAYSTYNDIINKGSSTCNGEELNRTAYWTPAIIDQNGRARVPERALIYYKSFNYGAPPGAVGQTKTYPDNMQVVADNSINRNSTDPAVISFGCVNYYNGNKTMQQETIPNCKNTISTNDGTGRLEMNIKFPQCWNGQDPSNYKVNLVPAANHWYSGNCPSSHPQIFPNLEYRIFFPVAAGEDTSGWFLSSDVDRVTSTINVVHGNSSHADWFGGWNKEINKTWIALCNNTPRADCGEGYLGGSLYTQTQFKALKRRREYPGYQGQFYMPGADIFNAMCGTGKPINKPADLAYCR